MKTAIWLTITAVLAVSCSHNSIDPAKYYAATVKMPLIDGNREFYDREDIDIDSGAKLMILQSSIGEKDNGYVRVVTDAGHDFGIVELKNIRKTPEPVLFPQHTVFPRNDSGIFYIKNNNSDSDSTIRDRYDLLCIFPARAVRAVIANEKGTVVHERTLVRREGYKYEEFMIDLKPFRIGDSKLVITAYDTKDRIIGQRGFSINKEDASSEMVFNHQRESFQYRIVKNEILLDRFFGFSKNDEDFINYKPDFNQYKIDGPGAYSFIVGIIPDQAKKRRSDMPLALRIFDGDVEKAQFDLSHYELTPSETEPVRIVEYPEAIVIYCAPPFEGAPRVIIYNKRTARVYDIWSLLQNNGIEEFHSAFTVSAGKDLRIGEIPFHFDDSEKPYAEYVVDLNTDRVVKVNAGI